MKQSDSDIYYLRIAQKTAERSKCLSRKIGSVLVRDGCIISTGVNGPARGVKHCNERDAKFYHEIETERNFSTKNIDKCPRRLFGYESGFGLHLCCAVHSERNTVLQAARNGISTLGTTLYCFCPLPCKDCCSELINAGIKEIVCLKGDLYDKYSRYILNEAKITIREIPLEAINGINK